MQPAIIDIHHHFVGKRRPSSMPEWSIESDAEAMERMGIVGALLSLPVSAAPELTRELNDTLAQNASYDPRRYGMLACLPNAPVDAALREIEYASDTLDADGFCMPTNACGVYLGDDRLDPVLSELDRRSAVVLVHPTKPGFELPMLHVTDLSVYEFPLETTRAVMDLVYRGKVTRFPNIRWVLSHAGGAIPYLSYRLSTVAEEVRASAVSREDVLNALASLYYDVSLSTCPNVFASLRELAGVEHLLFGSDYPMRHEPGVARSIEEATSCPGFTAEEQRLLLSGTARALFPRFGESTLAGV
ncbi:MAG: amidohydrolase family protein [Polyangiaceae bacterium]